METGNIKIVFAITSWNQPYFTVGKRAYWFYKNGTVTLSIHDSDNIIASNDVILCEL